MSGRPPPAGLFLAARVAVEPAVGLLLDARDPRRLQEVDVEPSIAAPEGAVVIVDGKLPEARAQSNGATLVTRALVWTLLDPCAAGVGDRLEAADRIEAERALKAEGRRLWAGLERWGSLDPELRAQCRALMAAGAPPARRFLEVVEALASASGGDPFAGFAAADEEVGALPRRTPALTLPAEQGEELRSWLLSPAGLGALLGPDFSPRPEQAEMALAVADAVSQGRPLLVEAGTGVGKTLAYLLPLVATLVREGGRAVVATHTRALQGQILGRELPLLRELFPSLTPRLLMGRRNYLCRRRRLRFLARPAAGGDDALARAALLLWLASTEAGQREELAGHPVLGRHLPELFDSPEPCSPSICHSGDECYVQRARRNAREADLVIVNHALLMNDFAAGGTLIGPYRWLVVDEAHRLPHAALDATSIRCDQGRLAVIEELLGEVSAGSPPTFLVRLAKALAPAEATGAAAARALAELGATVVACFQAYRVWLSAVGRQFDERAAIARPLGRVRVFDADEAFGATRAQAAALLAAASGAGSAFAGVVAAVERLSELPPGSEDDLATLARAGELLESLQRDVRFVTAASDDGWVVWLDPDPVSGVRAVGATRLEPGDILRDFWSGAGLAPVLTSATLSVAGDFGYMREELGLRRWHPAAATVCVDSPFDYRRQALFVTVTNLPPPDRSEFAAAVADLLERLLGTVRRKTLVLFTAYQTLQRVAALLQASGDLFSATRRLAPGVGPLLLAQSPGGDAGELLARFRREKRAVLLGTTTFWEGVDFPGTELELLVVVKLPFQVPNDPWVEARCDRIEAGGENAFETFMVRDAVLRLRQGAGRLIRRVTDRGAVVLLDSRLHSKPYGVTFLNALPAPALFCTDAEEAVARVAEFFAAQA